MSDPMDISSDEEEMSDSDINPSVSQSTQTWTCMYCNMEEKEGEEEERFCTCCQKKSTYFHADSEKCLAELRRLEETAANEEEQEKLRDIAKKMQESHRRIVMQQMSGEDLFFYNCEQCRVLECFGCKKATFSRGEPHSIGRLRASLCAACGTKASCAKKLKDKDYVKTLDDDVYLCSVACRKNYKKQLADQNMSTNFDDEFSLNAKQRRRVNEAISTYLDGQLSEYKLQADALQKYLSYFQEKEVEGSGQQIRVELVATEMGVVEMKQVISKSLRTEYLEAEEEVQRCKSANASVDTDFKQLKALLVSKIIAALNKLTKDREDRVEKFAELSKKAQAQEATSHLEFLTLTDVVLNALVSAQRRCRVHSNFQEMETEWDNSLGIGGADVLNHYKTLYAKAVGAKKAKRKFKKSMKERKQLLVAKTESIVASSEDMLDEKVNSFIETLQEEADFLFDDHDDDNEDDDENTSNLIARNFSYAVLNKFVWPIIHGTKCARVNFWQWKSYHRYRDIGDDETESALRNALKNRLNDSDMLFGGEDDDDDDEQDASAEQKAVGEEGKKNEGDVVDTVDKFFIFFDNQIKQQKAAKGKTIVQGTSECRAFDGVPDGWAEETKVSDEEFQKKKQIVNVLLSDCRAALEKKFNTIVLPPKFECFDKFEQKTSFDSFAVEDAKGRFEASMSDARKAVQTKMAECLNAYKNAHVESYTEPRNAIEEKYREKRQKYDKTEKKYTTSFLKLPFDLLNVPDSKLQEQDQKAFVWMINDNARVNTMVEYFAGLKIGGKKTSVSEEQRKQAQTKVSDDISACIKGWNKAIRKGKNLKDAWEKVFREQLRKRLYSKETTYTNQSLTHHVRKAVRDKKARYDKKTLELAAKRVDNRNKYIEALRNLDKNDAVVTAKQNFYEARQNILETVNSKYNELLEKHLQYYDYEDDVQENWIGRLTSVSAFQRAFDAEADVVHTDIITSMEDKVRGWQQDLLDEETEDRQLALKKENQASASYFKEELNSVKQKEKDTILAAYKRHTMFHHIGHASFVDCGAKAEKLAYVMTRDDFVDWEERSVEKYMQYYNRMFNPSSKKNREKSKREKQRMQKVYNVKDAEEGRRIALRQIRDEAIVRWGNEIPRYQKAWRKNKTEAMKASEERLHTVFRTTKWMEEVRKNEVRKEGLREKNVDEWHYDDSRLESRKKQPPILESEDVWREMTENGAIFGIRSEDAEIRSSPFGKFVSEKDKNNIMKCVYCPKCGLKGSHKFPVFDVPYPNFDFPDRNVYPDYIKDNKNLQFCGIGEKYHFDTTVKNQAKLHFAKNVATRDNVIASLAEFSTKRYVVVRNFRETTLPEGGCLQAYTRKKAVEKLEKWRQKRLEGSDKRAWATSPEAWLQALEQANNLAQHSEKLLIDVRDPLWRDVNVEAPPGYRLVQCGGWTWQLEPFYDPLQTPLMQMSREGEMEWQPGHQFGSQASLSALSDMCKEVKMNLFKGKQLSNLRRSQFDSSNTGLYREGAVQYDGDKPYAWTLPVVPSVDTAEDSLMNGVNGEHAKTARDLLKYDVERDDNKNLFVDTSSKIASWHMSPDITSDKTDLQRLKRRRNAFYTQQREVYRRCQGELSRKFVRQSAESFSLLYKKYTGSIGTDRANFVLAPDQLVVYRKRSCLHSAYALGERPGRASAMAKLPEVKAWIVSLLKKEPLRMYECPRSGKPCIFVENAANFGCDDIKICKDTMQVTPISARFFVTAQQYEIESNDSIEQNLKLLQEENAALSKDTAVTFAQVLTELGREKTQSNVERKRKSNDSDAATSSDDDDPEEEEEEEQIVLTKEMKSDGWSYDTVFKRYQREASVGRAKVSTLSPPVKHTDGKYYSLEEITKMEEKDAQKSDGDDDVNMGGEGIGGGGKSSSEEELSSSDDDDDDDIGQILSRIKSQSEPKSPEEYEIQSGTKCAMHALNNFLELGRGERFKLKDMQVFEPRRRGGFEIATIGKFLRVENDSGDITKYYGVSLAPTATFEEKDWDELSINENFLGFIAKPATNSDAGELEIEKAQNEMTAATEGLQMVMLIKVKEFLSEAMPANGDDIIAYAILLEKLQKKTVLDDPTLINDAKEAVEKAGDSDAKTKLLAGFVQLIQQNELNKEFGRQQWEQAQARESDRNTWHWIAVRKYTNGNFYVINSYGPTVTEWDPSFDNFLANFSRQKILVFATSKEAGKLQRKLERESHPVKTMARRAAATYFRDLFGMAKEYIQSALYPRKRTREGEAAAKEEEDTLAGAERSRKRPRHRNIEELYRLLSLHYD